VLEALGERGIPIAGLATVSGGSIIGGFYVAGGNPADFRDAVANGRFNLKREIIDFPNLLHVMCPARIPIIDFNLLWWCSYSRVDVQADLLDRLLFGGKRVEQLRKERDVNAPWWNRPPWWVIGATDLRHGEGVGLSVDGIFRRGHATPGRGLHQTDLQRVPSDVTFEDLTAQETYGAKRVAELIAVSGAFPGAFGSTRFPISEDDSLQIVDGGITDNLGYSLLMSTLERAPNSLHEKVWALDMVLVSDGGMPLQEDKHIVGYTEFFRAMDVVYASSGILVKPNNLNKIWLSPRTIDSRKLSEEDFARVPAAILKHRRVNTLAEFQADFDKTRNFFLATSTLKDRFDEGWLESLDRRFWHKDKLPGGNEAVDALFALGQYLVYVNLPDICKGLKILNDKCQR
jgi:predicted acylesterase/phospholipase RssA